jgi:hypothetical protein
MFSEHPVSAYKTTRCHSPEGYTLKGSVFQPPQAFIVAIINLNSLISNCSQALYTVVTSNSQHGLHKTSSKYDYKSLQGTNRITNGHFSCDVSPLAF